jgi:hypothetical protein
MSTTTVPKTPNPDLVAMATFPNLTIEQYHKMISTGIIPEGEPIELIEGYLVEKMSRGTPHDEVMDFLDLALAAARAFETGGTTRSELR